MNNNIQTIKDFLLKTVNSFSPSRVAILNFSTLKVIDIEIEGAVKIEKSSDFLKVSNEKFDLIIGDLPFGMQLTEIDTISKLKVSENWSYILRSLRKLKEHGRAFFLVEPSILFSQKGRNYLNDLSTENYFVNAVFELPEKLLYPETAFQPIVISFERTQTEKLFIGEITPNFEMLSENYLSKSDSGNLIEGLLIYRKNFESFSKFRIENQISNLQTQYNDYSRYALEEVAKEVNNTKGVFEDLPNSIYIPKIGNSPVVSQLEATTLKHQNYHQVVLNDVTVRAGFLALFYRSELGKLILKSLTSGSFIPNINKSDVLTSLVAIPSIEEQDLLILTNKSITELQETINQLQDELSLNPKNAKFILEKFENIQNPLKQLSEEDQILNLIRKGENKIIEFKQTFSKNIRTGEKDKDVEKSSLKTIVGFLNSDGGTLLIGVSDEGKITGIENDFFQGIDKYKLHFKNALESKIGPQFYPFFDYDLISISGHIVLKIDCKPSLEPCFLGETEFFVRTNPATDKLEGRKQHEYIRRHFK